MLRKQSMIKHTFDSVDLDEIGIFGNRNSKAKNNSFDMDIERKDSDMSSSS